jgi:hypothetical protein
LYVPTAKAQNPPRRICNASASEARAYPTVSLNRPSLSHVPQVLEENEKTHSTSTGTRTRLAWRIPYERAMWIFWTSIITLWIVDRFTTNLWPRQGFTVGRGTAGSDFSDGLKPGGWSVKFYDVCARTSGRFATLALNLLYMTTSHSTFYWLAESPFVTKYIDMRDCIEANHRLHYYSGILICVLTLVHVWSILFPTLEGYSIIVNPGVFEWPLSERTPKGFKDVNPLTKLVMMQVDDVWRIVEMTVLLGILMPFTIRWLATKYHLGITAHNVISVMYFVDIVRRHSHPHNWILNPPVFVWWLIDRCLISNYWRRSSPKIHRVSLSPDYMLLAWKQGRVLTTVGPKFFLKLANSSFLEKSHVFTCFQNHLNIHSKGIPEDADWDTMAIVRVYHAKRSFPLSTKDSVSHTHRMQAAENPMPLHVWGPFLGGMSDAVHDAITKNSQPVCVVAGGSAIPFLIDALQLAVKSASPCAPLTGIFTCSDSGLYQFVNTAVTCILKLKPKAEIFVALSLTHKGNDDLKKRNSETFDHTRSGNAMDQSLQMMDVSQHTSTSNQLDAIPVSKPALERRGSSFANVFGRVNFTERIPASSVVYLQGSAGMVKVAAKAAKMKHCTVVMGPSYDVDTNKAKKAGILDKVLPLSCCRKAPSDLPFPL